MRWHLPSIFQFLLSVNNWLNSRIKVASAGKDRTKAGIGWLKRRRGSRGHTDRYFDSLMRKASDLVTVRNDYFRHGGTRLL